MNENAVSPVVAVMLMLVVTIIIAAVVSGFAGGLMQSKNKAPQANIQGVFHVNGSVNYVIMTHNGGDEIPTANAQVEIIKSADWGPYQGNLNGADVISKSLIFNSAHQYWLNATNGGMDVLVWTPGQTMEVSPLSGYSSSDIGKTLILEIDTNEGQVISKSNMLIVN
jgi:FlaG/FlaF family flagellin (archaellin)